jgi:hypothetical protein
MTHENGQIEFSPLATWAVIKPCLALNPARPFVEGLFETSLRVDPRALEFRPVRLIAKTQELR